MPENPTQKSEQTEAEKEVKKEETPAAKNADEQEYNKTYVAINSVFGKLSSKLKGSKKKSESEGSEESKEKEKPLKNAKENMRSNKVRERLLSKAESSGEKKTSWLLIVGAVAVVALVIIFLTGGPFAKIKNLRSGQQAGISTKEAGITPDKEQSDTSGVSVEVEGSAKKRLVATLEDKETLTITRICGNSYLIQTEEAATLINPGGLSEEAEIKACLSDKGIEQLSKLIVASNNIGYENLIGFIETYRPKVVYLSGGLDSTYISRAETSATKVGASIVYPKAGDTSTFGGNVRGICLYPKENGGNTIFKVYSDDVSVLFCFGTKASDYDAMISNAFMSELDTKATVTIISAASFSSGDANLVDATDSESYIFTASQKADDLRSAIASKGKMYYDSDRIAEIQTDGQGYTVSGGKVQ